MVRHFRFYVLPLLALVNCAAFGMIPQSQSDPVTYRDRLPSVRVLVAKFFGALEPRLSEPVPVYRVVRVTQHANQTQDFVFPVNGKVRSPFGYRRRPRRSFHAGIDIGARTGTPIKAVSAGIVVSAKWCRGYGRTVTIDHGDGLLTRYAHCSAMTVKKGVHVQRGDIIGKVGSSGFSTGPHLHFEAVLKGKHVDPVQVLMGKRRV